MSESEEQKTETTETKSKKSPLAIIFLVLMIVLGIGVINNAQKNKSKESKNETTIQTSEKDNATELSKTESSKTVNNSLSSINDKALQLVDADFDVEKAATPRILGNPDAPIKISEHSSFTCGHCAKFHETNFKQIKADYVDTGKAYIVFDDFPRNKYDLNVGAIARCINEDAYFNFVQLLFETQKDWVNEEYLFYVKQNAKLTGATEAQIDNCINSTDLHEKMAEYRDAAMKNHDVNATPTLVIDDSIVIPGLSSYDEIKEVLDAELAKTAK